ncbi:uncharacterized protein LOC101846406 [Aplysia californica]|uniref:Uncharacterized protein LOC101846406 n=1 Tax=Aplysia californica TaxID=6500 RepID=A0ABM1AFR9_APLCA|nr:uncharacterized protein LOC101846406 [Aplysia californica]
MDGPWKLTVLVLAVTLTHLVSGQTFTFLGVKKIKFEPACGLLHNEGSWSVQGFLTINSTQLNTYSPVVHIQTTTEQCSIDLNDCGPRTSRSVDSCYCPSRNGDTYTLSVRQRARSMEDGQTLWAVLFSTDIYRPKGVTVLIGKLPRIYENLRGYYQVVGSPKVYLAVGRPFAIETNKRDVSIKWCVENLLTTYTLAMNVNGQMTSAKNDCVTAPSTLNTNRPTPYDVTLSLNEFAGCQRTESFRGTLQYNPEARSPTIPFPGSGDVETKKQDDDDDFGLDLEIFYGGILGAIAGITLIVFFFLLCWYHKRNKDTIMAMAREHELSSTTGEFTAL